MMADRTQLLRVPQLDVDRMNSFASAAIVTLFGIAAVHAQTDGTFRNFDFEDANVPNVRAGEYGSTSVPVSEAIPGWMAYHGSSVKGEIWHNVVPLGDQLTMILGREWDRAGQPIIGGSYSLVLGSAPGFAGAIAQMGTIPSEAKSLRFNATFFSEPTATVTFAGQQLPTLVLAETKDFRVFGADISGLAGQTGELRFTIDQGLSAAGHQTWTTIDDVRFSPIAVPEPASALLFLAGLGLCAILRSSFTSRNGL